MFEGQLIGVDVGGTKVAVATLEHGRLSDSLMRPTEVSSAEGLVDEIAAAVGEVRTDRTAAVGVGMPSVVEFATGRVRSSVNVHLADLDPEACSGSASRSRCSSITTRIWRRSARPSTNRV